MRKTATENIDLSLFPKRANHRAASPFRYPGGKGFLSALIASELAKRFPEEKPNYAEPFCGGAGAALNLLVDDSVGSIFLNDADPRIYSAWRAMVYETDRFVERIQKAPLNVTTWNSHLKTVHNLSSEPYDFELGFATFYINRTNRSGVILVL